MLISNYSERRSKAIQKRICILKFLRDETWTNVYIISMLIGLSKASAYKVLNQLKERGHVKSHFVVELKMTLWGITTMGLMNAWDDNEEIEDRPYFQLSKIKPVMVLHHLMIQQARLQAENSGWVDWTPGTLLAKGIAKRPDATVVDSEGRKISVELERTLKTKKRYEVIISLYLQAIRRGEYDEIHYVVPNHNFKKSLERMFILVTHVPVLGKRIILDNDKHKRRFKIFEISRWPKTTY